MQYVVNSFPNNFMSLMRAIAEEDESASPGTSMMGKAGSMTRVSSEGKLSRQMMKKRRSVVGGPPSSSGSVTELNRMGEPAY